MRFFQNPKYDFMNVRKIAFGISGALLIISILALVFHGPKFGIDFRGGTLLEIRFQDPRNPETPLSIPIDRVRSVFKSFGLENTEIKHYGSEQEIAILLDFGVSADTTLMANLYEGLQKEFPDYRIEERRRETVGPKIGQELVVSAIKAILVSLGLILLYIMFRFELRYGVGAVLALFHDVMITLGLFSIFDIEIDIPVIAALLTIVGYSLNDTIVVFDRIRENLAVMKRRVGSYTQLVNQSINDTLSRTIVTSGTTLIVVFILFLFGGEIIKDFTIALIFGIIIGTYSSIFIASPVLVEWENRKAARAAALKKR